MQGQLNNLEARIEPAVAGLGYELLCIEIQGSGKDSILRLYIDAPEGIGLDDCVAVSREVSALLDVEDPMEGAYRLEVSSPGADRPLVKPEHYQGFVGHETKLKLRLPREGRRNFRGRILACDATRLSLQVDKDTLDLDLADIERARLVPEFND